MTERQTSYSFPILKQHDICSCCKELGTPLTLDELNNPTLELMDGIYTKLVELIKGSCREDFRQPAFHAMDTLSNPDLHDESLPQIGLYRELLDLCVKTGIHDITLRDFLEPEKNRTKKVLSAIINFAKFREDKLDTFTSVTNSSTALLESRSECEHAEAVLLSEKEQLERENEEIVPQLQHLTTVCEQSKANIQSLVEQQTALREQIKVQKAGYEHLLERLSDEQAVLLSLEAENARLKQQIVPQPEQLKKNLINMTQQMHSQREEVDKQLNKMRNLQSKLNVITKIDEKLVKRSDGVCLVVSEQSSNVRLKKGCGELAQALVKADEEAQELTEKENQIKKSINVGSEKLIQLQKSLEQKRTTANMALEQVNNERNQLQRIVQNQKSKAEQNESLVALKKQQLATVESDHHRVMSNLRSKYALLHQSVRAYHDNLAAIINQQ